MRCISAEEIAGQTEALCLTACCSLPDDVLYALKTVLAGETPGGAAYETLRQIVENARLARQKRRPICQDTGLTVVFADVGRDVHLECDLYKAVNEGVRRAYVGGYLRKSVLGALDRRNTGDNTPATVHVRLVDGDRLRLAVLPRGFGSENMSRVCMLTPAEGTEGVLRAITDTVVQAGACACPPLVVGVGIGGDMETAALLAKRQLLRPLGVAGGETVRAMEAAALARINQSGIGPMGLGGRMTALAVHIEEQPTHIAGLPVAVCLQCHACRRAEGVL